MVQVTTCASDGFHRFLQENKLQLVMLFTEINKLEQKNFFIDGTNFEATWENYYNQYHYLIDKLITYGKDSYELNSTYKSIVFLLRQLIEILLKMNLCKESFDTHNIKTLMDKIGIMYDKEGYMGVSLRFDSDGSELRYEDENIDYSFNANDYQNDPKALVELSDIIKQYNLSFDSLVNFKPLTEFKLTNKERWNLTINLWEAKTIYQIRNGYEALIDIIWKMINSRIIEFKYCYIPLLFLVRHSIELSLKGLLLEASQEFGFTLKTHRKGKEHSIVSYLNEYIDFLQSITIENEQAMSEVENYKGKASSILGKVHDIDVDSLIFRFPFDKKNNPVKFNHSKINFGELFFTFKEINAFLILTNVVIQDAGYTMN